MSQTCNLWQTADALVSVFGRSAPSYAAGRAETLLGAGEHAKAVVYRRLADACETLLSQTDLGKPRVGVSGSV